MSSRDFIFMKNALAAARQGLGRVGNGRPSVGCVIVRDGVIVARARTGDGGAPHAEAQALEQAGHLAAGATAYVTLEPCAHHGRTPPCAQLLIDARIRRCVVACQDPFDRVDGAGIELLQNAGIEVETGLCEKEAREVNSGFFLSVTEKRPFITLKVASSADNKIAAAPGRRTTITGEHARSYTYLERSYHDAILIGSGTAKADDPLLTVRLPGYSFPLLRVVLGDVPENARLFEDTPCGSPLLVLDRGTDNLRAVCERLVEQGVTRLLVEGGARILESFLEAGLCDRFLWFRAPHELGPQGIDILPGAELPFALKRLNLNLTKTKAFGEDLLEIYEKNA